jgi:hypothetical protein
LTGLLGSISAQTRGPDRPPVPAQSEVDGAGVLAGGRKNVTLSGGGVCRRKRLEPQTSTSCCVYNQRRSEAPLKSAPYEPTIEGCSLQGLARPTREKSPRLT